MIQVRPNYFLLAKMPVMAKQYLFNARFWVLMTAVVLVVLVILNKRDWFLGSNSVAAQEVEQKYLSKDVNRNNNNDIIIKFHPKFPPNPEVFYGIMFDAGSTGSRIHVYQFSQDGKDSAIKLMNETFEAIEPGLSFYRKEPDAAAKSLAPLLDLALTKIPFNKRARTPVALKATAGLRLLPGNLADVILDEVHNLIRKYPFRSSKESVQIMDGTDEGIFSWMTVNFLLGSLSGQNKMVAALDLGGGSTQITFVPNSQVTFDKAPKDFLTDVTLFGKDYKLYTHSYLGLGLMSARFQIMGGKESTTSPKPTTANLNLSSVCLPPDYNSKFEHHGITYETRSSKETGFASCYKSVRNLIVDQHYNVDKVDELKTSPVYIFSYYYDRAVDTGLIDAKKGGEIVLKEYKEKALSICKDHIQKEPFLCMDLVYIYSLLKDGFGLPDDKHLYLKKKIAGVEISWALGAMFDMLEEETKSS